MHTQGPVNQFQHLHPQSWNLKIAKHALSALDF